MAILSSHKNYSGKKRGFTLVELAIVLGVAALLFAGLWRLMASGSDALRSQATADQQKQLIAAVKAYLASVPDGANILSTAGVGGTFTLALPSFAWVSPAACVIAMNTGTAQQKANQNICNFLPTGFNNGGGSATTNSYSQNYLNIHGIVGASVNAYSFMILTGGGDTIADTSGGRIASMIGSDGGFIYGNDVCTAQAAAGGPATAACGAYGSWAMDVTKYAYGADTGHVASLTFVGVGSTPLDPWLARNSTVVGNPVGVGTTPDYHTLQSDTFMDGTHIFSMEGSVLYGKKLAPAATVGGKIFGFSEYVAQMVGAGDNSAINITGGGGPCTNTIPPGVAGTVNAGGTVNGIPACNYVMTANGDVAVTGLLVADNLFSIKFVYDQSGVVSDMRLKKDIKPIDQSLDKIGQLKPVSFVRKLGGEKDLGFIAQDIEKVYPELIMNAGDGYKAVNYEGLIAPLVQSVQELKKENDALRTEVRMQGLELKKIKAKED